MKQYTEFIASKIVYGGKWDKEETTTWSFKKIRKNKNNVDKQKKNIRTKVQNKMIKFNRNVLNHKNIFVLDSRIKRQNCETGYI